MNDHLAMGPGREFDAVRALLAQWGPAARGVGDDAAVLDVPEGEKLVVSTDSTVEDVHFRRAWLSAEEIVWRATNKAGADLGTMRLVTTIPNGALDGSWGPTAPVPRRRRCERRRRGR